MVTSDVRIHLRSGNTIDCSVEHSHDEDTAEEVVKSLATDARRGWLQLGDTVVHMSAVEAVEVL